MTVDRDLTRALQRRATGVQSPGFDLDRVRTRARGIRRARRARTAAVAGLAVAAVVVPTTMLLPGGGDQRAVVPAHSGEPTPSATLSPSPSPTQQSSPSKPRQTKHAAQVRFATLASIPHGPDTGLTYLDTTGVVHSTGGTSRLPAPYDPSLQFTSYHGGWLVAGGLDNQLRQYDSQGTLIAHGRSGSIATSSDRMRTAWAMDGTVSAGISSGMGEGSQSWKVSPTTSLVGFLQDGPVVVEGEDAIRVLEYGGKSRTVQLGMLATTTSDTTGLVGGITGTVAAGDLEGAVVDSRTGTKLWHNSWRPVRFNADGSLVAAVPVADNGDPTSIAILDARTGEVLAKTRGLGKRIHLGLNLGWDGDRAEFTAFSDNGERQAVLALGVKGDLTRASDVVHSSQPGRNSFLFAVQP